MRALLAVPTRARTLAGMGIPPPDGETGQAATGHDTALGLAVRAVHAGRSAGRIALMPVRVAAHAPVLGPPLRRAASDLAHEGFLARARARATAETMAEDVLDDEMTERALERVLASPGLERLVVQVLESRLVDDVTELVLRSPEMERVVEHIATSPQVLDAVHHHTQSLAEEMVGNVRRRTRDADDAAERAVRGWLRRPRPRPQPS
jgi:hypothetical protein